MKVSNTFNLSALEARDTLYVLIFVRIHLIDLMNGKHIYFVNLQPALVHMDSARINIELLF